MKRLIISCTLMMLVCFITKAQKADTKLQPEPTVAGIYLKIGAFPSKGETVIISRNSGKGFEIIANLSAPENKTVLYQRMQAYSLRFPYYYTVSDQLAGKLMQLHQAGKTDSILNANIPVPLLGLGAAFLDTTKNLPEGTIYQVQLGKQTWTSKPLNFKPSLLKNQVYNFYDLKAAAQVIRIEWRVQVNEQPPLFVVHRKRLGIDSNFTQVKTALGFEKTKKGDSLSVHLSDTTVLAGISYQYILTGKDFLGRSVAVSDTIRSIAGNRTSVNGIDRFTTKVAPDSSGIMLQWNKQNANAIRSIRILRSAYYDSTYVQVAVLPATDSIWVDKAAAMGSNYYYQLVAQGQGDFAYPSPRVFGSFTNKQRLMAPTKLIASRAVEGAKLTWQYGSYLNLLGFRMYRSLGNAGKFLPISDLLPISRDTLAYFFIDKDKSLTSGEFYTYAVAAIGRNYVESPLSAIAQFNYIEKRKLTTPSQLRALMLNDSTVSITWQNTTADQSITGYHVFRKAIGADSVKGFKKLTSMPIVAGNEFTDAPGIGNVWQYVVQAINETDSSNFSLPVVARFMADKPLPPGKVQLFAQKNSVIISWDGTLIPNVSKYYIYRATASTAPVKIGSVAVNGTRTFEDKSAGSGNLYYYYVTTETNAKIESDKSKEVSIRLKQ